MLVKFNKLFSIMLNIFSITVKNVRFIYSPQKEQKINFMGQIINFHFMPQGAKMNFFIAPHIKNEHVFFLLIIFYEIKIKYKYIYY